MTRVILRVDPVASGAVDDVLVSLGPLRLVRDDAGRLVECDEAIVARAVAFLARAGLRAAPGGPIPATAHLVPMLARDLASIEIPAAVDVVDLRPLGTGDATSRLTTRVRWPGRRDPLILREILRGTERAFAWKRVVWVPRHAVRTRAGHGLRPIVFDRAALRRTEEHIAFTHEASLSRWMS